MAGVRKNFIYNSAYQILLVLTPIVTTPYLSRVIGPDGNGLFTYTQSIVNYFVLFAVLGMANYGVRTIAECGDDRARRSDAFWNMFAMNCLVGLAVLAVYVAFVLVFGMDEALLWALWSMWIIGSVGDVSWLMFGMQDFKVPTIRNFITRLASVIFIFVFVRDSGDIWAYVTAISGAFLVNTVLIWPFVGNYVDWVRPSWDKVIAHLKPNLALFIPVIASSLYVLLDKVMLGAMAGMEQTGLYDYAEKIATDVRYAEKSWGSYNVIDASPSSLTVKVMLNPGHRMSYHSHEHRDEIWTVLEGTGMTVIDGMEQHVRPGDVVTMAARCKHTIIAETSMILLETQIGEEISVKDKIKYELQGVIDPNNAPDAWSE